MLLFHRHQHATCAPGNLTGECCYSSSDACTWNSKWVVLSQKSSFSGINNLTMLSSQRNIHIDACNECKKSNKNNPGDNWNTDFQFVSNHQHISILDTNSQWLSLSRGWGRNSSGKSSSRNRSKRAWQVLLTNDRDKQVLLVRDVIQAFHCLQSL